MASFRTFASRNASSLLERSTLSAPAITSLRFTPSLRTFAAAAMSTRRLLDEIKVDHDNIRDLLDRFKDAHKRKDENLCSAIVNTIIHEAAVHSDAEELSVY
ncbi:hypothetical protein, partial [Sporisorium scitamineum]